MESVVVCYVYGQTLQLQRVQQASNAVSILISSLISGILSIYPAVKWKYHVPVTLFFSGCSNLSSDTILITVKMHFCSTLVYCQETEDTSWLEMLLVADFLTSYPIYSTYIDENVF